MSNVDICPFPLAIIYNNWYNCAQVVRLKQEMLQRPPLIVQVYHQKLLVQINLLIRKMEILQGSSEDCSACTAAGINMSLVSLKTCKLMSKPMAAGTTLHSHVGSQCITPAFKLSFQKYKKQNRECCGFSETF